MRHHLKRAIGQSLENINERSKQQPRSTQQRGGAILKSLRANLTPAELTAPPLPSPPPSHSLPMIISKDPFLQARVELRICGNRDRTADELILGVRDQSLRATKRMRPHCPANQNMKRGNVHAEGKMLQYTVGSPF